MVETTRHASGLRDERKPEDDPEPDQNRSGHEEGSGAMLQFRNDVRGRDEEERPCREAEAHWKPDGPRAEEEDAEKDPPPSGKSLSGGVDSNPLQRPKRFFGAAERGEAVG